MGCPESAVPVRPARELTLAARPVFGAAAAVDDADGRRRGARRCAVEPGSRWNAAGRDGAAVLVVAGLAGPGSFDSSVKVKSNRCSRDFGSYFTVAAALSGTAASCGGILRFECVPVARRCKRNGRQLFVRFVEDDQRSVEVLAGQRLLEVVVEEQPEQTGAWVGALDVMPGIFRHEELAAVHRIVVAVRTNFTPLDTGGSVGALSGIREVLLSRAFAARKEMRDRDRHEVASVDGTLARVLADDRRVVAARPRFDSMRTGCSTMLHFPDRCPACLRRRLRRLASCRRTRPASSAERLRSLWFALPGRLSRLRRPVAMRRRFGIAWNYFTEVMTPRAPALVASASSASSI